MPLKFLSRSEEETSRLATELARLLEPGDIILLKGQLGAGKTFFIRSASRALGVSEPVTSPSFTMGQTYSGFITVHHLDLYRLPGFNLQDQADLEPYFDDESVTFIEWPERAEGSLGEPVATITITHVDIHSRRFEITASKKLEQGLERFIAGSGL